MESIEAADIIKRMFKGGPTTEQILALEMTYEALKNSRQNLGY